MHKDNTTFFVPFLFYRVGLVLDKERASCSSREAEDSECAGSAAEPAVIRLIGRVMCAKKILRKFGLMSDVVLTQST